MAQGRVYPLNESSNPIFRTIFPDLDPEAKYILISDQGMLTFQEDPNQNLLNIPHMLILTYHDIEF